MATLLRQRALICLMAIAVATAPALGQSSINLNTGGASFPNESMHIGPNAVVSTESALAIGRSLDATGAGSPHGISVSDILTRSGGVGYAAYDMRGFISGTASFNHVAIYQGIPTFNTTGTTDWLYGSVFGATVNAGTITNVCWVCAANVTGAGTVLNKYIVASEPHAGGIALGYIGLGADPHYTLDISKTAGLGDGNYLRIGNLTSVSVPYNAEPYLGYNLRVYSGVLSYDNSFSDYASGILFSQGRVETFTAIQGVGNAPITPIAGPYLANGGTTWTSPSDAVLKQDIAAFDVLGRLSAQKEPIAYIFSLRSDSRHTKQIGTVAQRVSGAFPELVQRRGKYLGVQYEPMGPMALEGVRRLLVRQGDIERRISRLENLATVGKK